MPVDNRTTIYFPNLSRYLYQDFFVIGDLILQRQSFAVFGLAEENLFAVVLQTMSLSYMTISLFFYNIVNQGLFHELIFTLYYGNQTNNGEVVLVELITGVMLGV